MLPTTLVKKIMAKCSSLEGWKIVMLANMFTNSKRGVALKQGMQFNAALDKSRRTSFGDTFNEWFAIISAHVKA